MNGEQLSGMVTAAIEKRDGLLRALHKAHLTTIDHICAECHSQYEQQIRLAHALDDYNQAYDRIMAKYKLEADSIHAMWDCEHTPLYQK